jgi:allophanate hydrolase
VAGELLYGGPFVAERLAYLEDLLASSPGSFFTDTREILTAARSHSGADAFRGLHELARLRQAARPVWQAADAILLPTMPFVPTVAETLADPHGVTPRLGRYTNFTNLMDLAAVAVPAGFSADGLPVGVTLHGPAGSLHGPAGSDELLAGLASVLEASTR